MSKESAQIAEAIQRLAGTYNIQILQVVDTIVTSEVDETKLTFDTEFIKGVSVSAVPNDGIVLYPANGSTVKIALATKIPAFLVQSSDLEKARITIGDCEYFIDKDGIKLHGDNYGGLVKVGVNSTALNNLQTEINTLKLAVTALMAGYAPIDGGVSLAAFNAVILPQINISQIENTKVKHGNS